MAGNSSGVGVSSMRQRRSPFFSLHPVRIGDSPLSYMMTLFFVKIILQLASRMGPRPMSVWWKEGITFPSWGGSGGRLGIPKLADPLDWCGWPLAVVTVILGAVGSKLIVGAFFDKYNPLAPDSMMAVWSPWLRGLWALRGGGYG